MNVGGRGGVEGKGLWENLSRGQFLSCLNVDLDVPTWSVIVIVTAHVFLVKRTEI